MPNKWFAAYYSQDVETHLEASGWEDALAQALDKEGDHRGTLEALELIAARPVDGVKRHPSG